MEYLPGLVQLRRRTDQVDEGRGLRSGADGQPRRRPPRRDRVAGRADGGLSLRSPGCARKADSTTPSPAPSASRAKPAKPSSGSWTSCAGSIPPLANLRIGVSVMPGTDVAALAMEEGLISDESQLIEPTFYIAEGVRDWIVDYLKEEAAKHPRWNLW